MRPRNSSLTLLNRFQGIYKVLTPMMLSVSALSFQNTAQAASLNFSYASGTTLNQMIGFEIAGGIWSRHLADPVTVNLYLHTTNDLPKGVIGGALPGILPNQWYGSWKNQLAKDQTSADDVLAFKNLPSGDEDGFTARVNGKEFNENNKLRLTRANARALGMLSSRDTGLDGAIVINTLAGQSVGWNYDFLNNSVPNDALDFLSVGLHEIGHTLGFVSAVDEPGLLTSNAGGDDDDDDNEGSLNHPAPLDLFRYSKESAAIGAIDLSTGGNPFFSLDGGKTALGYFSTGKDKALGGDGNQASHWKQQDQPLGIMDPVLMVGQRRGISTLDLRAMDAIGWDLQALGIDLAVLQKEAKDRLAQRLGVTVAWLDENSELAATLLASDRTADVEAMIKQSEIYDWRSGSPSGLFQRVLLQTSPAVADAPTQAVAVPTPSLLPGLLLGKGMVILHTLRKRRQKK